MSLDTGTLKFAESLQKFSVYFRIAGIFFRPVFGCILSPKRNSVKCINNFVHIIALLK